MEIALLASLVSVVLLLSSGSKLLALGEFAHAIDEFSVLAKVPTILRRAVVGAIPILEAGTGALLLIPAGRHVGAVAAVVLSGGFVLVVALDQRPTIAHCGCWGIGSAEVPTKLYLGRSLLLFLSAAGLLAATLIDPASRVALSTRILSVGLAAPASLLVLEMPQIGHIVAIQRLVRGQS